MRGEGNELRRDAAIVSFCPCWIVEFVETESSRPLKDSLMLDAVEREEESVVLDAFVDRTEEVWDADWLADGVESLDVVEEWRETARDVSELLAPAPE
jgi:hypothetical protein